MNSFLTDIEEDGYHIFSLDKAKSPDFYPNRFPNYPGVKVHDLAVGDRITIRAFFPVEAKDSTRIDGGYIDLEVEHIEADHVLAVILTELPKEFALGTGDSIEVFEDEILYRTAAPVQ